MLAADAMCAAGCGCRDSTSPSTRCDAGTLHLQHDLGKFAGGDVRRIRRENLRKAALHLRARFIRITEPVELAVVVTDDGKELLAITDPGFTRENDIFLAIHCFGRSF